MSESLASLLIQVDHATAQAARAYFLKDASNHARWRDRCQFLNNAIRMFVRAEEDHA